MLFCILYFPWFVSLIYNVGLISKDIILIPFGFGLSSVSCPHCSPRWVKVSRLTGGVVFPGGIGLIPYPHLTTGASFNYCWRSLWLDSRFHPMVFRFGGFLRVSLLFSPGALCQLALCFRFVIAPSATPGIWTLQDLVLSGVRSYPHFVAWGGRLRCFVAPFDSFLFSKAFPPFLLRFALAYLLMPLPCQTMK